jgi:hypothetical protein
MSKPIKYTHVGGKLSVKNIKGFLKKSYSNKLEDHDGYQVDKDLSGQRFQTYYNPEKNHVVTVHRGTAGIHDMLTDVGLAFGYKKGKRFQFAKEQQRKADEKYANANKTVLGHSLGRALAEDANQHNNELLTLNGAVTPFDLLKKPKANEHHIRTNLDPVSALRGLQKKSKNDVTIASKSWNPLTEHSTDTLDRLNPELEIGSGLRKRKK